MKGQPTQCGQAREIGVCVARVGDGVTGIPSSNSFLSDVANGSFVGEGWGVQRWSQRLYGDD